MSNDLLVSELLQQLEGNRRLTLRVIEAFPEKELFSFKPTEPLRPFADMIKEIITIEEGYMRGIATKEWVIENRYDDISTKDELLRACENVRKKTLEWWGNITIDRLLQEEVDPFFGDAPQRHYDRLIYTLENEIHHRGQGYIYLRLLGIDPPAFYER